MKTSIVIRITISLLLLLLLSLPAAASDFTLGVFGNANEDDTINMQDVTYTELIILEYRDQTELSDAKYDSKINMQDVTQIELVILGKEKEITVLDSTDRIVTVEKPVKRIIAVNCYVVDPLRTLNAADKLVGVVDYITNAPEEYFGELCDLPCIGPYIPDYEVVLNLCPDLVILSTGSYHDAVLDTLESADSDLPIPRLEFGYPTPDHLSEEITKLGYIVDSRGEAKEFIEWYEGIIDIVKAGTDKLSDDEKPRVLYGTFSELSTNEWYTPLGGSTQHYSVETAGGLFVAEDLELPSGEYYVDLEWVIMQNPDVIVRYYYPGMWECYAEDDVAEIIAQREEVLNHPSLAEVNAVKNKKVQMLSTTFSYGQPYPLGIAYFAKTFHPELFCDLDPQAMHQEYLTEFLGIDYDLNEHGVFVYPPIED
ncbi:MAG: ABC transporter substrate-binding protein [Euryarchaeota archaeon]|nr:ABC transporter substrate-binding protein [Euryarchaeota archaeon]